MTILGAPLVAWGDLGNVVLVGFAGGVGLVLTWGLLLMGLERVQEVRSGQRAGAGLLVGYGAMALIGGVCTLALLLLGLWAITSS
jgi:hypothetical protein